MRSDQSGRTFREHGFVRAAIVWLLAWSVVGGVLTLRPKPHLAGARAGQASISSAAHAGRSKNIEDVQVGDFVLAKDPGESGPPTPHRVVGLPRNFTLHVVHVGIVGSDGGAAGEIVSTRAHPFFTRNRGWVNAAELLTGDKLEDARGRAVSVSSIRIEDRRTDTYNLTVDRVHTFYACAAGGDQSGVLVHNSGPLPEDMSHLTLHGSNMGQIQGREFRVDWLEVNQWDPNQPAHVRGWLAQEARNVELGKISAPRTPPGYEMGHGLATRASEGFDYSNARLTGADINDLEESARAKLAARACP